MSTENGVFLYVYPIYHSPSDFPGKFVLRRQAIMHDGDVVADGPGAEVVADSLDAVRAALPARVVLHLSASCRRPLPRGMLDIIYD